MLKHLGLQPLLDLFLAGWADLLQLRLVVIHNDVRRAIFKFCRSIYTVSPHDPDGNLRWQLKLENSLIVYTQDGPIHTPTAMSTGTYGYLK